MLVVPHHGSRTSSTLPFVRAVAPSLAVMASGYRNRFGHPRPDIVARYTGPGARVVRTDVLGAIVFDFDRAASVGTRAARAPIGRATGSPRPARLAAAGRRDGDSYTKRPMRTAVSPTRGRRVGITSTAWSYGVRTSRVSVAREQRSTAGDDREAGHRPHERELGGLDRHHVGDLDHALRRRGRGVEVRARESRHRACSK